MPTYKKKDFPVRKTRRFLELGPIVLVSSRWKDESNIMTMGWHMMLDYTVFGCYIWDENHSFELIRRSRQCVINVPTFDMLDKVIGIGDSTGADTDKFVRFGLTPVDAAKVDAPLIQECYANFECRLADASQIRSYGLFIWDVVAHVATSPKYPKTVHYRGDGVFMVAGPSISRRSQFKAQNL